MKNKELSYKVSFYSIIGIVVIIIYLACTSCATNKIPYEQGKKEWTCPQKKYKSKKFRHENTIFHRTNGAFKNQQQ